MKIKLSQKQWHNIGKKAGWVKTAGGDWFVNPEYTDKVEEVLKAQGDKIISKTSHTLVVQHKLMNDKNITLKMEIFQEEYEGFYMATVYAGDMQISMPDGETAEELIQNLNIQLRMILDEIDTQQFIKEI